VVGKDDADVLLFQAQEDSLDLYNRQRIDSGERFIQKQEFGIEDKGTADLEPASFPPRETESRLCSQRLESQLFEELIRYCRHFVFFVSFELEDHLEVFLYRCFEKNRVFLREIGDPFVGALIACVLRDVCSIQIDGPAVGLDQSHHHLEGCCFSCAVPSQEGYDLTGVDRDIDTFNDKTLPVTLFEILCSEDSHCLTLKLSAKILISKRACVKVP